MTQRFTKSTRHLVPPEQGNLAMSRRHMLFWSASVLTLGAASDANALFTQLLDLGMTRYIKVPILVVSETMNVSSGKRLDEMLGEFGKVAKMLNTVVQDLPQNRQHSIRRVAYEDNQTHRATYPNYYTAYYNYLGYQGFNFYRPNSVDFNQYHHSLMKLKGDHPIAYNSFTSAYGNSSYRYFGEMFDWRYASGYSSSFFKPSTDEEYTWIYIPGSPIALAFVSRSGYYKSVYPEVWRLMTAEHSEVFPNRSGVIKASQPLSRGGGSKATTRRGTELEFEDFVTPSGNTVKYSKQTFKLKETTGRLEATDNPQKGNWNAVAIQDPQDKNGTLMKLITTVETKEA